MAELPKVQGSSVFCFRELPKGGCHENRKKKYNLLVNISDRFWDCTTYAFQ
jgi:hypothetical protein